MKHIPNENIKTFIKAGKAIFTIKSKKTNKHFTYKVSKLNSKDIWFVSTRVGEEYIYIGTIFNNNFRTTAKSKQNESSSCFRAFKWFLNINVYNDVDVYHEGKCGKCGRSLTNPESIETGFGPSCVKMMKEN